MEQVPSAFAKRFKVSTSQMPRILGSIPFADDGPCSRSCRSSPIGGIQVLVSPIWVSPIWKTIYIIYDLEISLGAHQQGNRAKARNGESHDHVSVLYSFQLTISFEWIQQCQTRQSFKTAVPARSG